MLIENKPKQNYDKVCVFEIPQCYLRWLLKSLQKHTKKVKMQLFHGIPALADWIKKLSQAAYGPPDSSLPMPGLMAVV